MREIKKESLAEKAIADKETAKGAQILQEDKQNRKTAKETAKEITELLKSGAPVDNVMIQADVQNLLDLPGSSTESVRDTLVKGGCSQLQAESILRHFFGTVPQDAPKGHSPKDYKDREIPKVDWIVDGLVAPGVGTIASPPKYGKSFLMLQLAVSISEGFDFLGFNTKRSTVLYYDLEFGEDATARRMEKMYGKSFRDFDNIVYFGKNDNVGYLDNSSNNFIHNMETALLKNPNTRLVIIDVINSIIPPETKQSNTADGGKQAVYDEMKKLQAIVKKYGIAIIVVDHTRKGKDADDPFNDINGSIGKVAASDFIWVLRKQSRFADEGIMYCQSKEGASKELIMHKDPQNLRWVSDGEAKDYERMMLIEHPITKTIQALCEKEGKWQGTSADLMNEAYSIGIQIDDDAIRVGAFLNKNMTLLRQEGIYIRTKTMGGRKLLYIIEKNPYM